MSFAFSCHFLSRFRSCKHTGTRQLSLFICTPPPMFELPTSCQHARFIGFLYLSILTTWGRIQLCVRDRVWQCKVMWCLPMNTHTQVINNSFHSCLYATFFFQDVWHNKSPLTFSQLVKVCLRHFLCAGNLLFMSLCSFTYERKSRSRCVKYNLS